MAEQDLMGLHIVISGNPVDGFIYYGPFKTGVDAIAWAEANCDGTESWCIAPLHAATPA
jgi:hypothetical protein